MYKRAASESIARENLLYCRWVGWTYSEYAIDLARECEAVAASKADVYKLQTRGKKLRRAYIIIDRYIRC